MKAYFFIILLLCVGNLNAQTIEAQVVDIETGEAVQDAYVYFDGSSIVTTTNNTGHFKLSVNEQIHASLIVSHVLYEKNAFDEPFKKLPKIIYLKKELNKLDDIVVVPDRQTEKMKAFKQEFLGNTTAGKSCIILNEDKITLKYDDSAKILEAFSDVPIIVENTYLGYKITWEISEYKIQYTKDAKKPFDHDNATIISNKATIMFEDIAPNNRKIAKRRQEVYNSSSRRFFSMLTTGKTKEIYKYYGIDYSLLPKEVSENELYIVSKFNNLHNSLAHNRIFANELFTVSDSPSDKTLKTIKINSKSDNQAYVIATIYRILGRRAGPRPSVLYEISHIFFLTDTIQTDLKACHLTPTDKIIFVGEMGQHRLGDFLPIDYEP